jgi:hypothetical protein
MRLLEMVTLRPLLGLLLLLLLATMVIMNMLHLLLLLLLLLLVMMWLTSWLLVATMLLLLLGCPRLPTRLIALATKTVSEASLPLTKPFIHPSMHPLAHSSICAPIAAHNTAALVSPKAPIPHLSPQWFCFPLTLTSPALFACVTRT